MFSVFPFIFFIQNFSTQCEWGNNNAPCLRNTLFHFHISIFLSSSLSSLSINLMKSEQWVQKCQNHGDMRQKQPDKLQISSFCCFFYTCPDNNTSHRKKRRDERERKKEFQMTKLFICSSVRFETLFVFIKGKKMSTAKIPTEFQSIHL